MASGPYTHFNGNMLTLYDRDGKLVGSWPAISGVRQYQHPSLQGWPNVGPIPEGDYSFAPEQIQKLSPRDALFGLSYRGRDPGSMAAWGTERAFLNPGASTDTMGRSNFSIHGGFSPGSQGCIDLGPNEKAFFSAVRNLGNDPVQLFVKDDRRLETQPNPLANQTFFDGASDYFGRGTGIAWDGLKDIGNYLGFNRNACIWRRRSGFRDESRSEFSGLARQRHSQRIEAPSGHR